MDRWRKGEQERCRDTEKMIRRNEEKKRWRHGVDEEWRDKDIKR